MANWLKLLYVLVIALLYVPMVFLGANVFFPKFTGSESYFQPVKECYPRYSVAEECYSQYPAFPGLTPEQENAREQNVNACLAAKKQLQAEEQTRIDQCLAEQRAAEKAWNEERNVYNGWKYAAITGFNLVILILAILLPLADAVLMGVFIGTVVTAFAATVSYWDYARTKIGFVLMLITFFVVIFIVNKWARKLLQQQKLKKK
ncbi:MAG: hypothetical protein QXK08_04605 [Candidatus Woesearchaeota archaeon]